MCDMQDKAPSKRDEKVPGKLEILLQPSYKAGMRTETIIAVARKEEGISIQEEKEGVQGEQKTDKD